MKSKKGVSPVIVTVLLIAIVLVLAAIIFLWARTFIKEDIQKFNPAIPISSACNEVELAVSFEESGNSIRIANNAQRVPVFKIKINTENNGAKEVIPYPDAISLTPGDSTVLDISNSQYAGAVSITPILKGIKKGVSEAEYTCNKEILIS
ncbi:MAG: archaellin/type IV pilin N-terminal domain-containing protein [Candidatus Pacearchaeota archaeon]|jgi:flagellin-like protein